MKPTNGKNMQYSLIEHLAKISGGLDWRDVLVSAFTSYFDASGTQHDQPVLVVAGFLSTADQWLSFERDWLDRLKPRKQFHRTELNPHNVVEDKKLLRDCAAIIKSYAMRKFGMVVLVNDLHALVPKPDLDKWHLDAYSYAGRACAAHVRQWAEKDKLATMPELVYASGDTGWQQLKTRLNLDGFVHSVHFRPALDIRNPKTGMIDEAALPLQAGDLYAYELFNISRSLIKPHNLRRVDFGEVYDILDKLPGEPQLSASDSYAAFQERLDNFSGIDPTGNLVTFASWMPKGG